MAHAGGDPMPPGLVRAIAEQVSVGDDVDTVADTLATAFTNILISFARGSLSREKAAEGAAGSSTRKGVGEVGSARGRDPRQLIHGPKAGSGVRACIECF